VTEPGAGGGPTGPFAFVQLEFGFPLGPREGRYLVRRSEEAAPERVLVVATGEGEPVARGRLRRRGRARSNAEREHTRDDVAVAGHRMPADGVTASAQTG